MARDYDTNERTECTNLNGDEIPNGTFTYSCWWKATSFGSGATHRLMSMADDNSSPDYSFNIDVTNASGNVRVDIYAENANGSVDWQFTSSISAGTTASYHVIVQLDGSDLDATPSVWLDNTSLSTSSSNTVAGAMVRNAGHDLIFASDPWNVQPSEVQIWDATLFNGSLTSGQRSAMVTDKVMGFWCGGTIVWAVPMTDATAYVERENNTTTGFNDIGTVTTVTDPTRLYSPVSGTAAGTSGASGTLTVTGGDVTLDGTCAATSGASGNLSVARELSGTAAATSGTSGDLNVARSLSGTAAATSGASGDLPVARSLSGTCAATSGASGDLTLVGQVALDGTCAATSGASGNLNVARPLDGTAAATSGTSGALSVAWALQGTCAATSGASGDLTLGNPVSLDGTCTASSGTSGDITIARSLAGTAAGVSGTSGDLSVAWALVGTAAATSGASGLLRRSMFIDGTCAAVSGATGILAVGRTPPPVMLRGTVTTSKLSGTARGVDKLSGTVIGDTLKGGII